MALQIKDQSPKVSVVESGVALTGACSVGFCDSSAHAPLPVTAPPSKDKQSEKQSRLRRLSKAKAITSTNIPTPIVYLQRSICSE
jgi:hypothetical protein